MSAISNKKIILFLLLFSIIGIIPLTSPSSASTFYSATTYDGVLSYERFEAVIYDEPFQDDYVINWSYTISASYRHMVLLFTRENFDKVNAFLVLDFSHTTTDYYVLSDSDNLSAEGSFPIPATDMYVFVIYNNDSTCDFLHGVYVDYSVEVYDTIPDLPIGMIVALTIFGVLIIMVVNLLIWLRLKSKHLEQLDEITKTPLKHKEQKTRMQYKKGSSFKCANCREKIRTILDKCPKCNEPISCSICKLSIKKTDTLYKCPYCGCIGHSEHFLEWLEVNNKCPKCQVKLETESLILLHLIKVPDRQQTREQ